MRTAKSIKKAIRNPGLVRCRPTVAEGLQELLHLHPWRLGATAF